jgi:aryl-phospho-beta-D-glucosidase BglC (GH1 family)
MRRSRSRLPHVAVLLLLLAPVACAPSRAHSPPRSGAAVQGVPAARLARLARCVDITRWFWGVSDVAPLEALTTHFATYMGDEDLALIHRLGFRCVRLSIEPDLLYHKATPAVPDAVTLGYVDTAAKRLLAHDLAVIVDLHDDHPEKPFEHDPDYASGYAELWQALARHFSGWNPAMVFLEVLNEPVFKLDPRQWLPMQRHLLSVMRAGAPHLTLIATGPLWSSIDGLLMVKPVADPNVVYTFHFYEPATFTHEGAEWWVDGLDRYMHNLPYPSGTHQCAAAVATFINADVRASALTYCAANWNTAKLDGLIARAARWAETNRVPIMAGEFGVYCKHAPPADRLRWFRDVRAALNQYGIGWTLWGYDDCYGLGRTLDAQGHIVLDWGVVQALGLNDVRAIPADARGAG